MKRPRLLLLLGLLLVVPAGYLSNVVTRSRCELKAASELMTDLRNAAPDRPPPEAFVLPDSPPESAKALSAAGFRVRPCTDKTTAQCLPWVTVSRARTVGPYTMSVTREWLAGLTAGQGRELRYFCFFGIVIRISERRLWVS
jgi:hypothetical protein